MQLTQVIIGLVASATAVSAIDAYCWFGGGCNGNAGVCRNLNPNVCCQCSSGEVFPSVGLLGIPTFWNIEGRGHGGGNCATTKEIRSNGGTTNICLNRNPSYSGVGYGFIGKKRRGDTTSSGGYGGSLVDRSPEPVIGGTGCTSAAKLDEIHLGDGTKYNLTAVHNDEVKYSHILSFATADATAADVPAEFDDIKIVE